MLAWKLTIDVPGATVFELERGAEAAQAYIEGLGFTVPEAADGAWNVDCLEPAHLLPGEEPPEVTAREMEAAVAWDDAAKIAADACCAGWDKKKSERADLKLIDYGRVAADALDALYESAARSEVTKGLLRQAILAMTEHGATAEEATDEIMSAIAAGLTNGMGPAGAAGKLRGLADQIESAQR